MEDQMIVDLYWSRDEQAITETDVKYGKMLFRLAERILHSAQDSEEMLNDSYLAAWNSMPQNRPEYLGGYMAKIIRNLALNRSEKNNAVRRRGDSAAVELSECIPSLDASPAEEYENELLRKTIAAFLEALDTEKRVVFMKRYFFSESLAEISVETGLSESKLKSMLLRLRKRLKDALTEVYE